MIKKIIFFIKRPNNLLLVSETRSKLLVVLCYILFSVAVFATIMMIYDFSLNRIPLKLEMAFYFLASLLATYYWMAKKIKIDVFKVLISDFNKQQCKLELIALTVLMFYFIIATLLIATPFFLIYILIL